MVRRDVFQAIADPTRREIIRLVSRQPLNLNAVAERFDVSRPAISKHIKILTECGLVKIKVQGREHYCEAQLEKLSEVNDWVAQYKQFWEQKMDALEAYLQEIQQHQKSGEEKPSE
jgi:DNA-binding transcriptional ArsR family regulator